MEEGSGDPGVPAVTPASFSLPPDPVSRELGARAKASLEGEGRSLWVCRPEPQVGFGWGQPPLRPRPGLALQSKEELQINGLGVGPSSSLLLPFPKLWSWCASGNLLRIP